MVQRNQRGWLKKESRAQGETWVLFFRTSRKSDGKRVENKIPIGLVKDLPDKENAWAEIKRLHLPINKVDSRRGLTFGDLAQHYAEHELVDHTESIHPKAHTTVRSYERVLRNRLLPKWGHRIALGVEPLEVEQWLKDLKREKQFANPTLDKTRRVMSMIYKHGQRYGLIPRTQESNPMRFVRCRTTSAYEAMILTPEQAYAVLVNLQEPERTLTLLASGTGLRISECLGLQWQDVSFADSMIHVRRTWTCGQIGLPKSKASKGPVPLHPLLAEFMLLWKQKTAYSQSCDWVFPSFRLEGKQPRVANMLVEDHLRPAAVKAGILSSHRNLRGQLVDDDPRRFGFHNLRHSLASFLIRIRTDPKTVQTLLRHSDVKLTLQFYTHAVSRDRMTAAGKMLTAILSHAAGQSGPKADSPRIAPA
jgi:integrase